MDWLKTAERPHQEAAAEAKVARVAKQLDQAISAADGQRLQLLDAQAKAGEVGNAAAREAALGELRSQMDATIREPLRMLEQPEAAGRRLLDGKPAKAKKKGKNDLPPDAAKMDKRVRKRLKRLGRPATDYAVMLEAEVRGDPMPPRPRKAFKAPPAGVFADSLAVHAAVLKRMRELEAPEADYPKLLEQVLREGAER